MSGRLKAYSFSAYYLVTLMICTGNSLLFLFWSHIDADCGDRPVENSLSRCSSIRPSGGRLTANLDPSDKSRALRRTPRCGRVLLGAIDLKFEGDLGAPGIPL